MPSVEWTWGYGQWGAARWGDWRQGLVVGNHRVRLLIRWYDREDLFPTYYTLLAKEPTYTTTLSSYSSYQDLLDNVGGGIELDVDLTCDATGIQLRAGSDSSLDRPRASTLSFTLNDRDGKHDPRVPPMEGRTRTGSRVTLEVKPQDQGSWIPLFTGWVESWEKDLTPGDATVDVDCSDGFGMLARAVPYPVEPHAPGELSGARMQRVLDDVPWNDKWGPVALDNGVHTCNHLEWDGNVNALDHMLDVALIEDGLLHFTPDGTLRFEQQGWRATRTGVLGVDLIYGDPDDWQTTPDAVVCPQKLDAKDDDLDLINRCTVWRSTAYDPEVGDPPQQPDPDKRSAQDVQSISYHGVAAQTFGDLPNWSNTRSQQLADLYVARYAADRNDIGAVEFDLMKRPEDAAPVVSRWFGDTVVVRDRLPSGVLEQTHEVVGYSHRITPYRWEAELVLDRKVT